MVVRRAHVAVAQVGVRVDLQHRQTAMMRRGGGNERRRDRVLAAQRHQELVAAEDFMRDAPNLLDDLPHFAERQLHLGEREDADAVDVGAELLVPELHVRRGLQNFMRAVARSTDIRRRAIQRNGQDDRAGVAERLHLRHRAAEHQRRAVVVPEGKAHSQASKRKPFTY